MMNLDKIFITINEAIATMQYYAMVVVACAALWYVLFRLFMKLYSVVFEIQTTEYINNIPVFWNCSKKKRREILEVLTELPGAMCYTFAQKEYQLSILGHESYAKGPDKKVSLTSVGLFCPAEKMIFIDADRPLEEVKDTIYHEFGHFCDWIAGNGEVYGSDINGETLQLYFDSLYNENIPEYYRSNVREFVAYCASKFYCKPSVLSSEMLVLGEACFQFSFKEANALSKATEHT